MLTSGRNITAESAFTIAVNSLFEYGQAMSEKQRDQVWELCHSDSDIQWATTGYLAATSQYAPKAFEKLKALLTFKIEKAGI